MFHPDTPIELVTKHFNRLEADESLHWPQDLSFKYVDTTNPRNRRIPKLVVGGDADIIFPPSDVKGTGQAWGVEAKIFEGMGHDMMLEPKWEEVAEYITKWMKKETGASLGSRGQDF
eukprot:TRINITY_DN7741_c0_g1_i2.p2 TRINITY_DN7741_c0_g1~~TRINITY_DN7741_c0_g1_i2.p2  ORF type:complete len:117 (-),score=24.11 TRINITY_DN7741_c0_g1_i2:105-455(-)